MAYTTFEELLNAAEASGSLARAALQREVAESGECEETVLRRMSASLQVMRESVATGLSGTVRSRSGLVGGDAAKLAASPAGPVGGTFAAALAAALAVAEVNAAMGRIVASPTGGSSGVVPGVLLSLAGSRPGTTDDEVVDGLLVGAAIGGIIAARTNLSGAAAGCQAEVGAASAMAAAGGVALLGGSAERSGHAASLALQGLLGLACDPVGGLVEVPCVARNATGAAVAMSAVEMAMAGVTFPVPFDEVADALASIGRRMPRELRETAEGGLAATQSGKDLAEKSKRFG